MKRIKIIGFLVTIGLSLSIIAGCKFPGLEYDNSIEDTFTESDGKGLSTPDAIDMISKYSGDDVLQIKVNVLNNYDLIALANSIRKSKSFISLNLSSTNLNLISNFTGCTKLKEISLPDSVTVIDDSTFKGCENLTYIKMPFYLKKINYEAFADCKNLSNIDIPSLVTTIGKKVFNNPSLVISVRQNNEWNVGNNKSVLTTSNYMANPNYSWERS